MKSVSDILSSDHHFALFFIHEGIEDSVFSDITSLTLSDTGMMMAPLSIKYWIPDRNSVSPIAPLDHHFALFLIHSGWHHLCFLSVYFYHFH